MKRKIKYLSIIIIMMSMFFCNIMPSYAIITKDKNKGNITVSNLEKGVKVEIYRIATVNYNYEANQPEDIAYQWNSEVENWINSNYPNYIDPEKFYEDVETLSDESQDFYDNLTSAIKGKTIPMEPTATKKAEGEANYPVRENNLKSKVVFEQQEMGTYLIIIENGYMVYTPSVVNLVPSFDDNTKTWNLENQTAIIKASIPGITKSVTNMNKTEDNYSTKDKINYVIEADIPKYLDNSFNKNYYISDNLGKGLTIDKNSLVISGIKGELTEKLNEGYIINYDSVRPNQTEKSTFVINFDYEKIKEFDKIKIEYIAKLNSNDTLVLGNDGNSNSAYLDYTNNPYSQDNQETNTIQETDKIKVYTYGIEIEKVDKNNPEIKLSGAEFTLSDESGNLLYFIKTSDGVYYLTDKGTDNSTTNLIVNSNGLLTLKGIDEGKYVVTETHSPDNYNISTKTYEVQIKDVDVDGVLDGDEDGIFSFQFPNTKGFVIPFAGGTGSILFIIFGTMFVITGIVAFVILAKKKKEN